MSQDLNLNSIGFQNNLRSKQVRENFTDIENNYNSLRAEVNAGIASTASEVTSARDNFGNLSENIHARQAYGNKIISGTVSEQSTPDMTVQISAGSAIINGVGVKWDAQSSGTISSGGIGATQLRIDLVVANTDGTISIVTGAVASSPQFPSIASTQEQIAALLIRNGMTAIQDADDIFHLQPYNSTVPDICFGNGPVTLTHGQYVYNNLIVNAGVVNLDCDSTGGIYYFIPQMIKIVCLGNMYLRDSTAWTSTTTSILTAFYSDPGGGAQTASNYDGGGGGGGTPAAAGGTGGVGSAGGGPGTAGTLNFGATPIGINLARQMGGLIGSKGGDGALNGAIGTTSSNTRQIFLELYAKNISIKGDLNLNGANGTTETDPTNTGGGSGGNSGGFLTITAEEDLYIGTAATITCAGGDGGNGNDIGGTFSGGGGGGGGGGFVILRSKIYTNNGTITVAGGTGGTSTYANAGSNGNGGFIDQATTLEDITDAGGLKVLQPMPNQWIGFNRGF